MQPPPSGAAPSTFCWVDLAASDAACAKAFYAQVFGWHYVTQHANGGTFTRCRVGARDVASLYPLRPAQLQQGVPSHWTPYIRVDDLDGTARRVASSGGRVVVAPFEVDGTARIALIEDAVGALLGLWEPLPVGGLGTMNT